MVDALPPKGSDHALAVGILPRGPRCGQNLVDSNGAHATNEGRASCSGRSSEEGHHAAALSDDLFLTQKTLLTPLACEAQSG